MIATVIAHVSNEDVAAAVAKSLSKRFVNIDFEAVETGCGNYEIKAITQKNLHQSVIDRLYSAIQMVEIAYSIFIEGKVQE